MCEIHQRVRWETGPPDLQTLSAVHNAVSRADLYTLPEVASEVTAQHHIRSPRGLLTGTRPVSPPLLPSLSPPVAPVSPPQVERNSGPLPQFRTIDRRFASVRPELWGCS